MANRQYIGARYVPKFYDHEGSSEWRSDTSYENLVIVTRNNDSYTSKKAVPSTVGAPENNPEYWVKTGVGGSTEGLDTRVTNLENRVTTDESNISNISTSLQTTITNLSALTGRVTTAESDIDALESGLQTANSNISSVTNRVKTAEGNIDALETRVTTAEGNITSLQTIADDLQYIVNNILIELYSPDRYITNE